LDNLASDYKWGLWWVCGDNEKLDDKLVSYLHILKETNRPKGKEDGEALVGFLFPLCSEIAFL